MSALQKASVNGHHELVKFLESTNFQFASPIIMLTECQAMDYENSNSKISIASVDDDLKRTGCV